jgi:hypothetical protein
MIGKGFKTEGKVIKNAKDEKGKRNNTKAQKIDEFIS